MAVNSLPTPYTTLCVDWCAISGTMADPNWILFWVHQLQNITGCWDEMPPELRDWLQVQAGWNSYWRRGECNSHWERGRLGDASPQALLNTMIFMCGLYFALRSGQEHRQLRFQPCQIQLHEPQGGKPYLQYVEDISKNWPGGLKGRKQKPKVVKHHANTDHPERYFVCLFKLYMQKCPEGRPHDAFLSTAQACCGNW